MKYPATLSRQKVYSQLTQVTVEFVSVALSVRVGFTSLDRQEIEPDSGCLSWRGAMNRLNRFGILVPTYVGRSLVFVTLVGFTRFAPPEKAEGFNWSAEPMSQLNSTVTAPFAKLRKKICDDPQELTPILNGHT